MSTARYQLTREDLGALFDALAADGRAIFAPTARDGAIVYGRARGPDDLPAGLIESQAPGRYRLIDRGRGGDGEALFAHTLGPDSPKRFLHPPRLRLFTAARRGEGFAITEGPDLPRRLALIGPRACDLAAVAIQHRALVEVGEDPHYAARREALFIVAVQCVRAGDACFCPSMGGGPRLTAGFDLALTEIIDGEGHRFVLEIGSPAGATLAERLPLTPAPASDAPEAAAARAEAQITRRLNTRGLRERLLASLESTAWDAIAERCLGCAGCTMVCPTCFCTTVQDTTRLTGEADRTRTWDSCFHLDFSYIHGGPVRPGLGPRYRQWLTHKLATWGDQLGTPGCVGCGRCATWCPAGIDIVQEATAIAGEAT